MPLAGACLGASAVIITITQIDVVYMLLRSVISAISFVISAHARPVDLFPDAAAESDTRKAGSRSIMGLLSE